jgi:signal transduction histidine kinase
MTSNLRRLIRRVSQQEAAAAVGEFTASLAHEVRNPLTSVRLDLERAKERLGAGASIGELLDRALAQVERLDATVSGALRLARSGSLELTNLDLREPVSAALGTASRVFAKRSLQPVMWHAPDDALLVRGNAAALDQMLLNLLLNAADAIADGGCVTVATSTDNGTIRLMVSDTGRGMNPEELERALEPFFTTHPHGTGLGLTVVQRIAQAHGADMAIESEKGVGTMVTVSFPRT